MSNSLIIIKEKNKNYRFILNSFGDPESVALDLHGVDVTKMSGLELFTTLYLMPENSANGFCEFSYNFDLDNSKLKVTKRTLSDDFGALYNEINGTKIYDGTIFDFIQKYYFGR